MKEVNDIQSLQQRFCTQNKTKQSESISVRIVILYHTALVFKPFCLQLTIENIWTRHLSVWSHMAIKTRKRTFSGHAIKFKVAPWLERLSMKVVSSHVITINYKKDLNPKKGSSSKLSFSLTSSRFVNISGQTNWCLTFSKCSEIIVDHPKSRKCRLKNFTRKTFKAKWKRAKVWPPYLPFPLFKQNRAETYSP